MIIEGNGDLSEQFIELQKNLNPDFAIEIGAHEASFSQVISNLLNIESVAFEANPDVYNHFKGSIANARVKYLNYAISDVSRVITFHTHTSELAGNNSIKNRIGYNSIKEQEVRAYTLDDFVDEFDIEFSNLVLWIDCEGANREVLTGSVDTLKKCSSIFIETEDKLYWEDQWLTEDVINFLDSQGFSVQKSEDIYQAQKNIIFIRRTNETDYSSS
jgi:FkbM family methyltransferase